MSVFASVRQLEELERFRIGVFDVELDESSKLVSREVLLFL